MMIDATDATLAASKAKGSERENQKPDAARRLEAPKWGSSSHWSKGRS